MYELILILIVFAAIAYIAQPYFQKQVIANLAKGNGKFADLIEKRDSLLAQIKELEFDHEIGKLSTEDFAEMNARYRTEAIAVLHRLDGKHHKKRPAQKLEEELGRLRSKRQKGIRYCSRCGQSTTKNDRFCSSCGQQL
ncbi:MAG: zinc-ribbon domain-containing protein [bacterium]